VIVTVSGAQRRGRLVERHRLGVAAGSVAEAVASMIALHATDPVTVYLSAWARTGCGAGDVDEAIYNERVLVRMLGMRRTMFVVPAALVSVVQAACTDDVAKRLRRQLEKDLATGGVGDGDPAGWLRDLDSGVLAALHARGGGASGAQLAQDEPRLRTQLSYSLDKSYGGTANITSRVLVLLAAEGQLVRGHRRGGWSSGQFEWFPASAWVRATADGAREAGALDADAGEAVLDAGGGQTALDAGGRQAVLDAGGARVELAWRWLRTFGPAPVSDLQWWGGWTVGQTKAALAALPVAEVDLDGRPGIALADDLAFPGGGEAAPVATLLPALDPTPMGWQERDWFLGGHRPALFDRTGNIGPTVWWGGRVVGGWAQRASGEIACRLLADIGADGAAATSREAARLEAWLGANRVTPRFRTPLERELVGLAGVPGGAGGGVG
jgi:Winged helix DNA-binding domain